MVVFFGYPYPPPVGPLKAAGVSTCVTPPGPSRLDGHVPCKSYPNTSRDRDGKVKWGGTVASGEGCLVLVGSWLPSTKLTFSQLKMDGWKMSFLLGNPIFRCELLVSGRVIISLKQQIIIFWGAWQTHLLIKQQLVEIHPSWTSNVPFLNPCE